MHTQTSSRKRVKEDTVGEGGISELYSSYETCTLEDFRNKCISLIGESSGKKGTKDKFVTEITRATSKEAMLFKVNNYLLAGQGFGV